MIVDMDYWKATFWDVDAVSRLGDGRRQEGLASEA
jgi:hypothetical protein